MIETIISLVVILHTATGWQTKTVARYQNVYSCQIARDQLTEVASADKVCILSADR